MAKKKRSIDYKAARQAEFSVIACTAEVISHNLGRLLFVLLSLVGGTALLFKGHYIIAVPFLLLGLAHLIEIKKTWLLAGKVVLSFQSNGLRHHDQFFQWDDIARVELNRYGLGPYSIRLTTRDAKGWLILNESLEISLEEVASEIEKRLNPKA